MFIDQTGTNAPNVDIDCIALLALTNGNGFVGRRFRKGNE
jgi:hypothetical protein